MDAAVRKIGKDNDLKLGEKRRLGLPDELILGLRTFEMVLYHIINVLPPW